MEHFPKSCPWHGGWICPPWVALVGVLSSVESQSFLSRPLQRVLGQGVALLPSQICACLAQPECRWGMCWAWLENSMAKILQHLHLLIALDSTNHKTPVAVDNCNFLQIATAALLINKYTRIHFMSKMSFNTNCYTYVDNIELCQSQFKLKKEFIRFLI